MYLSLHVYCVSSRQMQMYFREMNEDGKKWWWWESLHILVTLSLVRLSLQWLGGVEWRSGCSSASGVPSRLG